MTGCQAFCRDLVRFTLSRDVTENWLRTTLAFVQRHCLHDPGHVVADLTEGDLRGYKIKHCRTCGATWNEERDE